MKMWIMCAAINKGQVRIKSYSLFLQVPFDDINRMGLYEKIRTEE